jgi:hypothetical protein
MTFIVFEIMQLVTEGFKNYVSDIWNWFDWASLSMIICVIVMSWMGADAHL